MKLDELKALDVCRPVRTPSYLRIGRKTIGHNVIRTSGAKSETGPKTEHGTPDQNTNSRKLSDWKGSGGQVKTIWKRASWLRKARPKWKTWETLDSKEASQGRSGCNVQLTLKRVARKKPKPKVPKVKSRGHMFVFKQEERTRHTPQTVREYRPCGPMQRKKPDAYRSQKNVLRRRKITTDARKAKKTHPRRSKGRRGKYFINIYQVPGMLKTRSTVRPTGNSNSRCGATKNAKFGWRVRKNKTEDILRGCWVCIRVRNGKGVSDPCARK